MQLLLYAVLKNFCHCYPNVESLSITFIAQEYTFSHIHFMTGTTRQTKINSTQQSNEFKVCQVPNLHKTFLGEKKNTSESALFRQVSTIFFFSSAPKTAYRLE